MPLLVFTANVSGWNVPENIPTLLADLNTCTGQVTPVRQRL
jgi:hypothetical protein